MIAETMTVVRTHGPRDYRVEEIPVPSPGPGEVLIEVDACGICASDMKCWLGGELFWGSDGKSGYCEPPAVAGHEFAGHVVALGEGASERHSVQLGDRVIAEQDRQADTRAHADMEFLAREVASLRMAVGEVATRDFLRSELRSLLSELDERAEVSPEAPDQPRPPAS